MADIEIVLDAGAAIGESPTWCGAEAALYWIDVKAPALHRLDPATGRTRRWDVPADIGAFALLPGLDGAIVALRTGLHRLDFATGGLDQVAPAPFDPRTHRFNEGACDPAGRFWVGVMFDPEDPDAPQHSDTLYSYTTEGGLRAEADASHLHNGMAFSPDGGAMFLSHSRHGTIYRLGMRGGAIASRALFATVPGADGVPDGAALDAAGGYWCALHGGGRLRRHHPDGTVDRDIALPVSQPTMCCFGDAGLDALYVTSAREGLTPERLRDEPHAGALLRLWPGETGAARRCTLG